MFGTGLGNFAWSFPAYLSALADLAGQWTAQIRQLPAKVREMERGGCYNGPYSAPKAWEHECPIEASAVMRLGARG